jgi:hypothetical protein
MTRIARTLTRREILRGVGASALAAATSRHMRGADYRQADTNWFAACRFGVSTHWTAQSQPVGVDDWMPFEETVARFNPASYVEQVAAAGAQYVIFTGTHALQMLPAPSAAIDRIAPGRTTRRDLIGELADACRARGLHFILYYNHSCNSGDDPAWEHAVGYHAPDKSKLTTNLLGIVRELSARYGSSVEAWWFDSCFSLDPRGVYNSVTTDLHGFQFPWEAWTEAAKTGYEARLVTLSSGMLTHFLYSTHQDYEGGEANDLVAVPSSRFTPDHLQGHRWVCLDNPAWVHSRVATPMASPRFHLDQVADYVRTSNLSSVPVTFNIDIDRTGLLSPESLALLRQVKSRLP